jgi:uncharacterized protein YkwD
MPVKILTPAALKCITVTLFVLLAIILSFFALNYRPFQPSERVIVMASDDVVEEEQEIVNGDQVLTAINTLRAQDNLPLLKSNELLDKAAQSKMSDMCQTQYWSHTSPDGVDPWHWITKAGYVYLSAGENLGRDFRTADDLIKAWVESPTHHENLVSQKYTETGIAVRRCLIDTKKTMVIVQLFASPASNQ